MFLLRLQVDDPSLRVLMSAAGELLQGERDALLKLIQSLRHEYEAVQLAKQGQEAEIQGLKVFVPSQCCYLLQLSDAKSTKRGAWLLLHVSSCIAVLMLVRMLLTVSMRV